VQKGGEIRLYVGSAFSWISNEQDVCRRNRVKSPSPASVSPTH
jgi:hypothetical protein